LDKTFLIYGIVERKKGKDTKIWTRNDGISIYAYTDGGKTEGKSEKAKYIE